VAYNVVTHYFRYELMRHLWCMTLFWTQWRNVGVCKSRGIWRSDL